METASRVGFERSGRTGDLKRGTDKAQPVLSASMPLSPGHSFQLTWICLATPARHSLD